MAVIVLVLLLLPACYGFIFLPSPFVKALQPLDRHGMALNGSLQVFENLNVINFSSSAPFWLRPDTVGSSLVDIETNFPSLSVPTSHLPFFSLRDETDVAPSGARELSSGGFTCKSLPAGYDPMTFCSGVVDYPFLVLDSSSLGALEASARALAAMGIPFLKTSCLTDIKRFICANIYLECVSNGEWIFASRLLRPLLFRNAPHLTSILSLNPTTK